MGGGGEGREDCSLWLLLRAGFAGGRSEGENAPGVGSFCCFLAPKGDFGGGTLPEVTNSAPLSAADVRRVPGMGMGSKALLSESRTLLLPGLTVAVILGMNFCGDLGEDAGEGVGDGVVFPSRARRISESRGRGGKTSIGSGKGLSWIDVFE